MSKGANTVLVTNVEPVGTDIGPVTNQYGSCRETMHGASRLNIGCVEITMGPLGTNMVSVWFNMGPIDD